MPIANKRRELFVVLAFLACLCITKLWKVGPGKTKTEVRDVIHILDDQSSLLKGIYSQLSSVKNELAIKKIDNSTHKSSNEASVDAVAAKLKQCIERSKELVELQQSQISQMAQIKDDGEGKRTINPEPHNTVEAVLRSAHDNVVELWYSISGRLSYLYKERFTQPEKANEITGMIDDLRMQKSSALIEIELLQLLQGEEQTEEMQKLQDLVQRRIRYVQNPEDCAGARKLICDFDKACGLGCQMNRMLQCFLLSYGTERTLILRAKSWQYSSGGWESFFLPLSETCTQSHEPSELWFSGTEDKTVHLAPFATHRYLPLNIPEEFAEKLKQYHGYPGVWWLGQFVHYLLRPQPWLQKSVDDFERKIGFEHPIVGIQVRRTDKVGDEASFHSVDEYMIHVVDWFDKEDMKRERLGLPKIEFRRVYVASDDPSVFEEAAKRYQGYKILGDQEISKSAGISTRYSTASLTGLVTDIFLLSKCDFVVGTFSSRVSHRVYELLQTRHADGSALVHSLDDVYFFGAGLRHNHQVLYANQQKTRDRFPEMGLEKGKVVGVAGNHFDGYSKITYRRKQRVGLFPSYKLRDIITTVEFPKYPKAEEIDLDEAA